MDKPREAISNSIGRKSYLQHAKKNQQLRLNKVRNFLFLGFLEQINLIRLVLQSTEKYEKVSNISLHTSFHITYKKT